MDLNDLLGVVSKKFGHSRDQLCFQFSLGRIAGRWQFQVVDDWHKWLAMDLQWHFVGNTPINAVAKFLAYVEANNIKVHSLTAKGR